MTRPPHDPSLNAMADAMVEAINHDALANIFENSCLPGRRSMAKLVDALLDLLFPGVFGEKPVKEKELPGYLRENFHAVGSVLENYVGMCLSFRPKTDGSVTGTEIPGHEVTAKAKAIVGEFFQALPWIRQVLSHDLQAAYEGDPAAGSILEVLMGYPFVEAIATHRLAHELYRQKVPLLPRMMNEVAHSRTGIDIHPGATIGSGFFIDHGTGVVIGETSVLGKGVKLYQGVTLGALSFPKDKDGSLIKGVKRHPNIEDGVTIYAGSTVLGGQTTIGKGSTIGGNCWITSSVPPETLVLAEHNRRERA